MKFYDSMFSEIFSLNGQLLPGANGGGALSQKTVTNLCFKTKSYTCAIFLIFQKQHLIL